MAVLRRSNLWKTLILIGGVFLPILTFVINHKIDRHPLYPEWDDGTVTLWIRLALTWEIHIYLYPLIAWAMLSLIADLFFASVRYHPWVRTGLLGGCAIAGLFSLLYCCVIIHIPPVIFVFPPVLSPMLACGTYVHVYRWNRKEHRDRIPSSQRKSMFIPTSVFSLYGMASATAAFQKMQQLHAALPKNPPDCYLATAAGMAHPAIARPRATMTVGGKSVVVTSQLQSIKALEIAIMALFPGMHRRIRRLYDRHGPRLAARCGRRFATALYLLLIPIAFVSRGLLRMMFRDARRIVDDAYRA